MIQTSVCASPGGSAPFQCHCSQRPELVSDPVSSAKQVVGSRKTSVWMLLGSTSLKGPWFSQKLAVSVASGSMTTRYLSFASAALTLLLLGADISGLKPWQK